MKYFYKELVLELFDKFYIINEIFVYYFSNKSIVIHKWSWRRVKKEFQLIEKKKL